MSSLAESFRRLLRSPALKLFLIGLLCLVLMVPLFLVWALVEDRVNRSNEVQNELAQSWGGSQALSGPYLVVPYVVRTVSTDSNGKTQELLQERRAAFLPETLDITGKASTNTLHRAIYEVTVYDTALDLKGRFAKPDPSGLAESIVSIRWRDAVLSFNLTQVSGLKEATSVVIAGQGEVPLEPSPGLPSNTSQNGVHVPLSRLPGLFLPGTDAQTPAGLSGFEFSLHLAFNGSSELLFAPVARETSVAIGSDWPAPSFSGSFLPAERSITDKGFTASWRVPSLARSVPDVWHIDEYGMSERLMPYQFGVRFYVPVDFYDLVTRAVKYGLLFIISSFMAVFLLELLSGRRVHPVQYGFTGIALVFFFVLLLSLAEHMGFGPAYLIASLATAGMLGLYVGKSLESSQKGTVMLGVLLILYGLLYLVLRLEDYALLAGALMGFAMLTAVMFLTLRVDWSGESRTGDGSGPAALPEPASA